jgi:hypothetical protein
MKTGNVFRSVSGGIERSDTPERRCWMKLIRRSPLLIAVALLFVRGLTAQTPANDPSARLREVLPADVAQRVLDRIAAARAHKLPAAALENRALKFAARGIAPRDIERSVNEQADRMEIARQAIATGRGANAAGDEIEAGAEAMRKGVDGGAVSSLAKSAPHDRSLAVPLFVIGSLTDRGLSSDDALKRVLARLQAKATDADLEGMPAALPPQAASGQGHKPTNAGSSNGRGPTSTGKPAWAGPPAGVPGNGGSRSNPGHSHKPPHK